MLGFLVLLCQINREVNCRVGAHIHEQKLGCGNGQNIHRHAGRAWQWLCQKFSQNRFNFAAVTKRRCHKGMGKGAVPAFQKTKLSICFEQLIKRLLIKSDALQQAYGGAPGQQAGLLILCG